MIHSFSNGIVYSPPVREQTQQIQQQQIGPVAIIPHQQNATCKVANPNIQQQQFPSQQYQLPSQQHSQNQQQHPSILGSNNQIAFTNSTNTVVLGQSLAQSPAFGEGITLQQQPAEKIKKAKELKLSNVVKDLNAAGKNSLNIFFFYNL